MEEVTRDLGFNILEGNMEPVLGVSWGDYLKLTINEMEIVDFPWYHIKEGVRKFRNLGILE